MFRNYVINQLTQSSTWIGLAIIIADLIFPRSFIMFLGLLLLINDDARLKGFFSTLKTDIEKWWK